MNWTTLPYMILYVLSLALSAGVGMYCWKHRAENGAAPYALVALSQVAWTLGYLFEIVSPDVVGKIFWDNIQFIGTAGWCMAFLAFTLQYTGRRVARPWRIYGWIALPFVATILLAFTDSLHGLIRARIRLVPGEPFSALIYDFTVLFWVVAIYFYSIYLVCLGLLIARYVRAQPLYRAQVGLILVGNLVPIGGTVLTLTVLSNSPYRDLSPLTFAVGNLIVAWGLFSYRLFEVVPVARDTIVESMDDAVYVLDAHGRVVDLNPAGRRALGQAESNVIGQPITEVFAAWPDLIERYRAIEGEYAEIDVDTAGGRRHIDLRIQPLRDRRGRFKGRVLVARDMTERKRVEEELRQHRDHLEDLVRARTAELTTTNEQLRQEIAERGQAEATLRESEARFATVFRASPVAISISTLAEGRFLDVNDSFLHILGYERAEVIGRTALELAMWATPTVRDHLAQALRSNQTVHNLDSQFRTKSGEIHDALASVELIELGGVRCILALIYDITERKRGEVALRESEERYARLADAAFEGLGFSENGIIIDANARLADILCYRREELIGLRVEQIVAPESRDLVQRRSQTGYQGMYEHLALRKDGTIVPVEVRSRRAQYHGRPIRVTAIRDISERLAAEQALAASELRFRVAFHANPAPQLLTRAPDGFIIDVNPAYERLVGYARDDLLGKSTKDHAVWVEWDREQLAHILQAQGRIVDRATQVRTRSGAVCDVILSIEPVQIGETACYLGVMIDITERKQAEEDLRTYTRRLEYLQDIDQIILSSRSVAEIADAAMRRLCALIVCSRAEVLFIDGETNEVAIVAQVTDRPTSIQVGFRYSLAERPPRAALLAGQIVIEQDISDETLASPSLQRLRDEGMRARMIVPLLVQGQFIGAIHLTADQPYALTDEQRRVARELADHLAIGLQSARLFAEVQAANARLQTLSRQLVTAQEDERRHIARELHDEIGQALALVKLNIRAVQRTAGSSDLTPRLEQSLGVIEDTLLRVRALALDLRPSVLDDLGLVAALQWYLDQQAHLAGLAAEVIVATHVDRLPTEIETVCFRVVQEALSNVVRHAQARSFRVTVEQRDNMAGLVICDDGVGFDAGRALARAVQGQSGGLLGMQERVMLCGGRLTIESSAQHGTTIRAWIPLPLESPIAAGEKEQSA